MHQGVLLQTRTRLLLDNSHPGYRARRTGERKRKVRYASARPEVEY